MDPGTLCLDKHCRHEMKKKCERRYFFVFRHTSHTHIQKNPNERTRTGSAVLAKVDPRPTAHAGGDPCVGQVLWISRVLCAPLFDAATAPALFGAGKSCILVWIRINAVSRTCGGSVHWCPILSVPVELQWGDQRLAKRSFGDMRTLAPRRFRMSNGKRINI